MGTLADDPKTVKFIYWDNLTYAPPGSRNPEAWDPQLGMELYQSYLHHCVEAERLGYAGVSMPEHFGASSVCPYPNIMMAALAIKTSKIRIISGVNIPLWHHPMELAEQLAMIDVLSGGRLEVGLGRHGDRQAQEHAIDLIDGVLHQIDFPVAKADLTLLAAAFLKDTEVAKVNVWPRPAQKRVPLWVAAGSEGSLATAARRGHSVLTGRNINPSVGETETLTIEDLVPRIKRYIEIGQEAGHNLSMANVAVTCFTAIADTDKEAAEIMRRGMLNHLQGAAGFIARARGVAKSDDDPIQVLFAGAGEGEAARMKAALEARSESNNRNPFSFVGSVKTVREKLEALMSAGFTRFILPCGGVGTDHQTSWGIARAMAGDVAPDLFAPVVTRSADTPAQVRAV